MGYCNVFTLFVSGEGTLEKRNGAAVFCSEDGQGIRRSVKAGGRRSGETHQTIIPIDHQVGAMDLEGEQFDGLRLLTTHLNRRPSGTLVFDPFGAGFASEAYVLFIAPDGFSVDECDIITQGVRQKGKVFLIRVSARDVVTLRGPVCGEEVKFSLSFDPAKGKLTKEGSMTSGS